MVDWIKALFTKPEFSSPNPHGIRKGVISASCALT